jgi:HrpA-like RNA helicase
MERHFDDFDVPEIQRTPLEELCLQILFLGQRGSCSFWQEPAFMHRYP